MAQQAITVATRGDINYIAIRPSTTKTLKVNPKHDRDLQIGPNPMPETNLQPRISKPNILMRTYELPESLTRFRNLDPQFEVSEAHANPHLKLFRPKLQTNKCAV